MKDKTELVPGQCVRLFDLKRKVWEPATITGVAETPRSYIVQRLEGGAPLRRNRIHIKTTKEKWSTDTPQTPSDDETSPLIGNVVGGANNRVNSSDEQLTSSEDQDHRHSTREKRTRRQTVFFQAR